MSGAPGARFHLGVALDGAGWHPAAWRAPSARPAELLTSRYWIDQARTAERGLLDLLTLEDTFGLQSARLRELDDRSDQVRGRLDASTLACHLAPATERIGIIPVVTTTYPEPFHVASALSTLDHVSRGRAGWQPRVSGRPADAALVGVPRPGTPPTSSDGQPAAPNIDDLFDEAVDAVEVVRRLWDSWEDDAIITDVATGRFVDRDKLHHIDFEGRWFRVKGPSIVPRPPQGQPVVAALVHQPVPFRFAARTADLAFLTPAGVDDVARWVADLRAAEDEVGRDREPLRLLADLVVFLDATPAAAADRKARLDDLAGRALRSDAAIFTGTPVQLADELVAWHARGLDGFRLRPGEAIHDLAAIADGLVPALIERGAFRPSTQPSTLRARLGFDRPASRYARSA